MTRIERTDFYGISPSEMAIRERSALTENYSALIRAIIIKAVKDYSELKTKLNSLKNALAKDSVQKEMGEIEDFFRSKWFKILTGVNGTIYIQSLRNGTFKFAELYNK